MSKSLRNLVIGLIVILVLGFGYFLLTSDPADQSPATTSSPTTSQPNITATAATGAYIAYDENTVTNTQGTRLLFFHAPWCPQCRQLEASIKAGTIPKDVTIFKVDYDSNQKLRQRYGVTIQTTVVLLNKDGSEAKKFVAYDQPNLDAVINSLL